MTTASKKLRARSKSEIEIEAEISALKVLRDKIPPFTAFGHDNRAALDAEIDVLQDRMTQDEVIDKYEIDDDPEGGYILANALDATDWLWNEDDYLIPERKGQKCQAPSEGWANLIADKAA